MAEFSSGNNNRMHHSRPLLRRDIRAPTSYSSPPFSAPANFRARERQLMASRRGAPIARSRARPCAPGNSHNPCGCHLKLRNFVTEAPGREREITGRPCRRIHHFSLYRRERDRELTGQDRSTEILALPLDRNPGSARYPAG